MKKCLDYLGNQFLGKTYCRVAVAVLLTLTCGSLELRAEEYSASEWLKETVDSSLSAAEILSLLNETVGRGASSGIKAASSYALRKGLYVTAISRKPNIILRFDVDRISTGHRYRIAEVAITADLGREFYALVQAALATATSVFDRDHFAQPWDLALNTHSYSGGQLTLAVHGDASAQFALTWTFASPKRPIARFTVPTAFSSEDSEYPNTENLSGVVHFPLSSQEFQFLSNIYGVGQRFKDFPLYPHNWLHLTVTNSANDEYVTVHFDAITINKRRVFVAEAPASIDVGGRFLDETLTRMQETLRGAPGTWTTEFPYQQSNSGVVTPSVTGDPALNGVFDVAYHLQTYTEYVTPGGKKAY
jgi:hypothetical protein